MIENKTGQLNQAITGILANFNKLRQSETPSEQYSEIRKCPFFDSLPDKQLFLLAEQSAIKRFLPGARIATENVNGASFFVILHGTATAYTNEMNLGVIQRGECIGENVFFSDKHLSATTVIANGAVVALEIPKKVVDGLSIEVKTCLDKALMKAMFNKLLRSNILNEILHKQWITSLGQKPEIQNQ